MDSDIPDDKTEVMLEKGLPGEYKWKRRRSHVLYDEKEKLRLNEKGHNHFEVMTEGWYR